MAKPTVQRAFEHRQQGRVLSAAAVAAAAASAPPRPGKRPLVPARDAAVKVRPSRVVPPLPSIIHHRVTAETKAVLTGELRENPAKRPKLRNLCGVAVAAAAAAASSVTSSIPKGAAPQPVDADEDRDLRKSIRRQRRQQDTADSTARDEVVASPVRPVSREPPLHGEPPEPQWTSLVRGKLRVEARGQLLFKDATQVLIEEVEQVLGWLNPGSGPLCINDLDVSENPLRATDLHALLRVLSTSEARVERFRLFGCPYLGDAGALALANWLSILPEGMAPFELHLSHCEITTVGFAALLEAIQGSPAFPVIDPRSRQYRPLYLRLEFNRIDVGAIEEQVDSGIMQPLVKPDRASKTETASCYCNDPDVKVRLVVKRAGFYDQCPAPTRKRSAGVGLALSVGGCATGGKQPPCRKTSRLLRDAAAAAAASVRAAKQAKRSAEVADVDVDEDAVALSALLPRRLRLRRQPRVGAPAKRMLSHALQHAAIFSGEGGAARRSGPKSARTVTADGLIDVEESSEEWSCWDEESEEENMGDDLDELESPTYISEEDVEVVEEDDEEELQELDEDMDEKVTQQHIEAVDSESEDTATPDGLKKLLEEVHDEEEEAVDEEEEEEEEEEAQHLQQDVESGEAAEEFEDFHEDDDTGEEDSDDFLAASLQLLLAGQETR